MTSCQSIFSLLLVLYCGCHCDLTGMSYLSNSHRWCSTSIWSLPRIQENLLSNTLWPLRCLWRNQREVISIAIYSQTVLFINKIQGPFFKPIYFPGYLLNLTVSLKSWYHCFPPILNILVPPPTFFWMCWIYRIRNLMRNCNEVVSF